MIDLQKQLLCWLFSLNSKKNFFSSQIFLTSQFNHYLCEAKCFVESSFNVYIFSGDGMICFFSFRWKKYIEMSQLRCQEAIIFNPLNFIILHHFRAQKIKLQNPENLIFKLLSKPVPIPCKIYLFSSILLTQKQKILQLHSIQHRTILVN